MDADADSNANAGGSALALPGPSMRAKNAPGMHESIKLEEFKNQNSYILLKRLMHLKKK